MSAALRDTLRLLTFRATREGLDGFGRAHLVLGLVATWIVGMGRWWDDPGASLLQKTGAGSLAYVVFLSLLLYLVGLPLFPRAWTYRHVLTFVSLTSPPAALYAIPVERMVSLEVATHLNLAFLLVVATWRVALLAFYLVRHAALAWWKVFSAMLLSLSFIVIGLTILNLERDIIEIMGGLREPSAEAAAAGVVAFLALLAYLSFLPLLLLYAAGIWHSVRARRLARAAGEQPAAS
jgi:hypothetical protein